MKKFCDPPQLFHGPPYSEENDSPLKLGVKQHKILVGGKIGYKTRLNSCLGVFSSEGQISIRVCFENLWSTLALECPPPKKKKYPHEWTSELRLNRAFSLVLHCFDFTWISSQSVVFQLKLGIFNLELFWQKKCLGQQLPLFWDVSKLHLNIFPHFHYDE